MKNTFMLSLFILLTLLSCKSDPINRSDTMPDTEEVDSANRLFDSKESNVFPLKDNDKNEPKNDAEPVPNPPKLNGMSDECATLQLELLPILESIINNGGTEGEWERYGSIYELNEHKNCLKKYQEYRNKIETLEERIQ